LQVSIVRPESPGEPAELCIIIDVLRATTTAAVLCQRLGELCLLRTPADLDQLPPGSYALFSELSGIVCEHPRFDNSPVQARDAEITGTPVLVTTNGTLAVGIAAQLAPQIVLASFVNLSAIADHVTRTAPSRIAIMPAGNIKSAKRCSEDDACAEALAARLAGAELDLPARIAAVRADPRILRRQAAEPGLPADLDLCFSVDVVAVVPVVTAVGAWFRVATQPSPP